MKKHLTIGLLFLVLSIAMTWPAVTYVGNGVAGWEGDNLFYVWQLWWAKHALLDLRISPLFDPRAYYPEGYNLANGELSPANSILFLPVTALGGPVVSYNVIVLFSFWASALGAYLWVWQLTRQRSAALIAGTIFAFLPYRFAHLPGHLELMSTQWIPLTLFALERLVAHRQLRWAVAAGLGAALTALSSWYYAYAACLLLPVYVLLRARPWRTYWLRREWWLGLAVALIAALALVLPFAVPYYQLSSRGQLARDISQMDAWSLNPYDFFLPNLLHPLWSKSAGSLFPRQGSQWVERGIALGYLACGLGLIGLLKSKRTLWAAAVIALWCVAYAIALGPTLHWQDQPVKIGPLSAIPLPSFFLYKWVPFTSGMRVMTRFGLWTGLMTAALAGWGGYHVIERLRPHGRALAVGALISVILFESYGMAYGKLPLTPRPVDLWLAQANPRTVIVELPLKQGMRPMQDYYSTVHQQATVLGPVGDSFDSTVRAQRTKVLSKFPSAKSLEMLRAWGTDYVLFTPSQIENWDELVLALDASGVMHLERTVGDVYVYRFQP